MNFRNLLVAFVCVAIAAPVFANLPDPALSTASSYGSEVSVFTLPNGTGQPLTAAKLEAGGEVDATIDVTLLNALGNPIALYPAEDLWLETSLGGLTACVGGNIADAPTDGSGQTTFSSALFGGGYSDRVGGEVTRVIINGVAMVGSDMAILFNSADIDGSLTVDLSDTVAFVPLYTGAYDYAVDFFFDGVINLSDLVKYAGGLNATCP